MEKKNKDETVKHLLDALDGVCELLDKLSYNDYYCDYCDDTSDYSRNFYADIEKIKDYIWHKKADVIY